MTTDTLDIKTLDQFDKDTLFIDTHRLEWLDSYSDGWVVVYEESLICHAETLEEALLIARKQGLEQNMAVERISTNPRSFLL